MSILATATKGKIKRSHSVLIYGGDGVGKSTFASQFPSPIFLGSEKGTANLDVTRVSIDGVTKLFTVLNELFLEAHDYQTVVIDSLDWLEPLVWDHVCREANVTSIEKVGGGYGKGYTEAIGVWRKVASELENLRERKGMNVVLIAHSHIKTVTDPSLPAPYDRHQLKLNDKAAALWREAVDSVLFATFETFVNKKEGEKKARAFGDGKRVMYTERRPAYDAKNRFGLPHEMALDFTEYQTRVAGADQSDVALLKRDIEELIAQVQDEGLKKTMTETYKGFGEDKEKLTVLLNRIKARLS